MNRTITIKGIHDHEAEHSKSIRNYIEDRLDKLEKLLQFINDPVFLNITIEVSKPHPHHLCDLRIHGPNHLEIIVKKEDPELYKVIDYSLDLAEQEVIKFKEKMLKDNRTADYHK